MQVTLISLQRYRRNASEVTPVSTQVKVGAFQSYIHFGSLTLSSTVRELRGVQQLGFASIETYVLVADEHFRRIV